MGLKNYLIYCFSFIGFMAWSQTERNGQVLEAVTDMPIPGVNVIIKGTNNGVVTDFDGNYSIMATSQDTLVFSYVGFQNKEILVGNKVTMNVSLEENTEALSEVVVVGYGSQKREDITGAVGVIDAEETFKERPNNDLGSLIQGQAAGVKVLKSSGKPSAGFNIRVRGTSSISAGSDPLYVIDGVPTTDTRSLNPSDIESISILKDASSAAIYGAQGANGVVLITTKQGKSEKAQFQFDSYVGVAQVWKTLEVLNAEQYRDLMTELGYNTQWDQYNENTDWQNKVFRDALSHNYQLYFWRIFKSRRCCKKCRNGAIQL